MFFNKSTVIKIFYYRIQWNPITASYTDTYVAEKCRQLIADGISQLDALLNMSKLLGYEPADVTNICRAYLEKAQYSIV